LRGEQTSFELRGRGESGERRVAQGCERRGGDSKTEGDGTARRGRREYVRGAVLRGDPIQLGHVSGDTEGDTRGRHTSFSHPCVSPREFEEGKGSWPDGRFGK